MADDFVPSAPKWNAYIEDDQGNIDYKDRSRSGGLWPGKKLDSNGKTYYQGKVAGRRIQIYEFVPKEEREQKEEEW
jgi:hypothetical protein